MCARKTSLLTVDRVCRCWIRFIPTGPNVMSETTVGTTPWHQISLKFCTGPDTKLVQLSVIRVRGRTFPTEITGSFWLDTVVLKSLGPASESACAASAH